MVCKWLPWDGLGSMRRDTTRLARDVQYKSRHRQSKAHEWHRGAPGTGCLKTVELQEQIHAILISQRVSLASILCPMLYELGHCFFACLLDSVGGLGLRESTSCWKRDLDWNASEWVENNGMRLNWHGTWAEIAIESKDGLGWTGSCQINIDHHRSARLTSV